jgi:hypothetical protein
MTCPSCGGACGPEALKKASNEILLAEINARRESAVKQLDEFYKTHWSWGKFCNVSMVAFSGFFLLCIFAGAFGFQIIQEPIMAISMNMAAFTVFAIVIFIIFKDGRVRTQFKKEYPKETKLLSGI